MRVVDGFEPVDIADAYRQRLAGARGMGNGVVKLDHQAVTASQSGQGIVRDTVFGLAEGRFDRGEISQDDGQRYAHQEQGGRTAQQHHPLQAAAAGFLLGKARRQKILLLVLHLLNAFADFFHVFRAMVGRQNPAGCPEALVVADLQQLIQQFEVVENQRLQLERCEIAGAGCPR